MILTPHTLSAGIATFTGVWCLFLSSLTPVAAMQNALHRPALVVTKKHLGTRAFPSALVTTREKTAPALVATAPPPKPRHRIESH